MRKSIHSIWTASFVSRKVSRQRVQKSAKMLVFSRWWNKNGWGTCTHIHTRMHTHARIHAHTHKRAAEITEKRPPDADDEQHQKGQLHSHTQKHTQSYRQNNWDNRAAMTRDNKQDTITSSVPLPSIQILLYYYLFPIISFFISYLLKFAPTCAVPCVLFWTEILIIISIEFSLVSP